MSARLTEDRLTDAQPLARRARPLTDEEKRIKAATFFRVKRQAHVPNVPANVERTREDWS